jgi:hypothetical protein
MKYAYVTGATLWWKEMCYDSKLVKAAVSVLGMPPTSAATGNSFITYRILHMAHRNNKYYLNKSWQDDLNTWLKMWNF